MAAEKKNGKGQRDARGRFASGNSGKPKGARHRTTLAVEKLLGADANKLTRKVIELALSGDSTALKLAIDRVAPVRRGRPVIIDNFPKVTSAAEDGHNGRSVKARTSDDRCMRHDHSRAQGPGEGEQA